MKERIGEKTNEKNQFLQQIIGERGIRTPDSSSNYAGFQDRSYQPLSHLSQR